MTKYAMPCTISNNILLVTVIMILWSIEFDHEIFRNMNGKTHLKLYSWAKLVGCCFSAIEFEIELNILLGGKLLRQDEIGRKKIWHSFKNIQYLLKDSIS